MRWRVRVREGESVKTLEGSGLFDELWVGHWLHLEWMDRRGWWMRTDDLRWTIRVGGRRTTRVEIERDQYPTCGVGPEAWMPWGFQLFDRSQRIVARGDDGLVEAWAKGWFHLVLVTPERWHLRVGETCAVVARAADRLHVTFDEPVRWV